MPVSWLLSYLRLVSVGYLVGEQELHVDRVCPARKQHVSLSHRVDVLTAAVRCEDDLFYPWPQS